MVDFRMNQAASAATQRSAAGATATAGTCCPLFNNLFFMNTFAPQAPLLPASDVAQQCPQLARINANQRTQQQPAPQRQQQQQPSNVVLPTLQSLNQQLSAVVGQQQQHQHQQQQQQQQHQQLSQRPQDHTSNNYSTSNLSLQHLVANRHSAHSCMYLAAALARVSAGFRQSQHQAAPQQQHPQNHQAAPINQPTVNPVTASSANSTNQVPLLNFNNYSSAPQPFLDLSTLPAPPIAAHLSSSPIANIQRLTNSISNPNPVAQNLAPNNNVSAPASAQNQQQQASQNFRDVQPATQQPQLQQQHQPQSTPVQQLFQDFNDQFQAILLNQLFPNQQFAPTLGASTNPAPQPQQQIVAQQVNPSRPQTLNQAGQAPVVMPPAQQIATQIPQQLQSSELVFEAQQQQQQQQQQQNYQSNSSAPRSETFAATVNTSSNQASQLNGVTLQHRAPAEPLAQVNHTQSSQQQQQGPQPQFVPQPQQQHQQPQAAIPPMTLYSLPQMEQALALLANPTVANNLFSHVFNLYLQTGLRTEPHDNYHHASHHFPHHLHNPHHHHHHPNGQTNGQDSTMPLDSLAISESKPRGLNRAEIDSLTPYIHTNEKDSRTCVICLSKFELKSKIRPLPCSHAFHAKCVDKWLRANRTCPICRRDALKTYNAKLKRI